MEQFITPDEIKNLSPDLTAEELSKIVDELNERVATLIGEEIISSLVPSDVDTLAEMQDTESEETLASWIMHRVPDYEEIIKDNKAIVLGEYAETIDGNPEDIENEEE